MKKEEKKQLKKLYVSICIIVFFIILIDQISKILVIHYGEITLISNTLILKATDFNNGVYNETSRAVTILTNLVILFIIFGIIKSNNQFITKNTKILLSFALAGGISNMIDRICRGNVVEFINFSNLPALNIADICIAIGWISFVAIFACFSTKELSKKKTEEIDEQKAEKK